MLAQQSFIKKDSYTDFRENPTTVLSLILDDRDGRGLHIWRSSFIFRKERLKWMMFVVMLRKTQLLADFIIRLLPYFDCINCPCKPCNNPFRIRMLGWLRRYENNWGSALHKFKETATTILHFATNHLRIRV